MYRTSTYTQYTWTLQRRFNIVGFPETRIYIMKEYAMVYRINVSCREMDTIGIML